MNASRATKAELLAALRKNDAALLREKARRTRLTARVAELEAELQSRNQALSDAQTKVAETLEQQTATSEILRVISTSPTDVQPVFDAIAEAAGRLFHAWSASVFRFDGELVHVGALSGASPESNVGFRQSFPWRPERNTPLGRCILDRTIQHVRDTLDENLHFREIARARGYRSVLHVPMLRGGELVGDIAVSRVEPGGFSPAEIALLQTFADQAVIAIENVRLFKELQQKNDALTTAHAQVSEALDQQTATSEILRVISSSPTDAQPVFDTIVRSAAQLCRAATAAVFRTDGRMLYHPANYGGSPEALTIVRARYPRPLDMESTPGMAILTRSVLQVPDIEDPSALEFLRQNGRLLGFRSIVTVPILREGEAVGALIVARRESGQFSDAEVELLKTFTDQAVIAIENVRLFTELQEKNSALTDAHCQVSEALKRQTATSDILGVISSSPTNVQPVFDAIARNARDLLAGHSVSVTRLMGDEVHLVAFSTVNPEGDAVLREGYPVRLDQWPLAQRTVRDGIATIVDDVETHSDATERARRVARARGFRSFVWMPMIHAGGTVGWISVTRAEPGPFSHNQIALLQTFADQAVIAIENVRLFTELQEKNEALTAAHGQVTEALEQQTATSEILRVISSSPTDVEPVFETILANTNRLCESNFSVLWLWDGETLTAAAHENVSPALAERLRVARVRLDTGTSPVGWTVRQRAVVHVPDVLADSRFSPADVPSHQLEGARSILSVPMLREGRLVGVINTWRLEPRAFSDKQIALLKTFADQAVIAIENVRLFKELESRTQELTRSVGELRALGEVGQAISSTLDLRTVLSTIVAWATQLSGTDAGVVYEYDEHREVFVPRATEHLEADIVETMLSTPVRKGEGATGRLAEVPEPIQLPDILEAPAESRVRGALVRAGYRALLAVPLVREDHLLGGLTVIRKATGAFAPEVIELLRTFATQSSLAIQNARLFLEIEDKSRQLEAASQHKSEFLANMSHELRTPLNAIIGFAEVLTERMFGELNEKQDEYLKDIYASGQHLLSLINDILDLSKIEAGRMELEPSDFDLPSAIDNALTLVRERAGRRGIALGREVDGRVGTIRADERKVKQVVLNLLSNAIKFTPEGGRIDVRATANGDLVEVSVADTGVGIAPEDQEAVFEEFRQVGTADKKVEGTGLGLALSRKFIELHGGRIWVKSELGHGSTFTFTLPVRCEPGERGGAPTPIS